MSQRLRILVVGAGSIGERHTRCFAATGRADVSLCEIDPARRQAVAERYCVRETYARLGEALEVQEARPHAVVIATPANLHVAMAREAVSAGCDVLIEKPLSTSLAGVAELGELAARKERRVGVAYVYRSHPALKAMREALQSGRFGKPLEVVAVSGQHFPFYRPAYRETYYTSHATGGGAVQDALTHIINASEWLVGPVESLAADAAHLALPGVEVEDTVHVLTRHAGVLGSFSLNQHQAPNETSITVVCEKGTLRFELHEHRWRWLVEPGGNWHDESPGAGERDTLFIAQANHFLDVVERRADPVCSLAEALQTLRVNLAILKNVRTRNWESIDTRDG